MNITPAFRQVCGALFLASLSAVWAAPAAGAEPDQATLRVRAADRSAHVIPKHITGKFTEHLFHNVSHGIEAQILRNPTFAEVPFWTGQQSPDGVSTFHWEREKITEELRRQGRRFGWPDAELGPLTDAWNDSLAGWWTRLGGREAVQVSPDTAAHGQRAQRV